MSLVQSLGSALPAIRIATTAHSTEETQTLREAGADVVLEPFQDGADRAVEILGGARERERTESPPLPSEAPE